MAMEPETHYITFDEAFRAVDMPFPFEGDEDFRRFLEGSFREKVESQLAERGLVVLALWDEGPMVTRLPRGGAPYAGGVPRDQDPIVGTRLARAHMERARRHDGAPSDRRGVLGAPARRHAQSCSHLFWRFSGGPCSASANGSPGAFHPYFSPDGRLIAFADDRGGNLEIYTITVEGTNMRQLTDNGSLERRAQLWPRRPIRLFWNPH